MHFLQAYYSGSKYSVVVLHVVLPERKVERILGGMQVEISVDDPPPLLWSLQSQKDVHFELLPSVSSTGGIILIAEMTGGGRFSVYSTVYEALLVFSSNNIRLYRL